MYEWPGGLNLKFFGPGEFDRPELMDGGFLRELDTLRERCGFPLTITDDAREKQRDQFAEMNADKARAAESRREVDRLAAQYGPALDKLSAEDLIEYLPTGPARVTLLKHGWRAPTIRARMLRTFVNRQE